VSGDVVVDDHILLRILIGDEPSSLRRIGVGALFTTGLWYHRLCRALSNPSVHGAMSRSLAEAYPGVGPAAVRSVITLPETIGLVTLRELAWPMAQVVESGVRLNLLSLEALAAAQHLDAEICLAELDQNPPLLDAAARVGVTIRLIGT
jgi:hypothetical protein